MNKTATILLLMPFFFVGCSGNSDTANNSDSNRQVAKRPGLLSTDVDPAGGDAVSESQVRPGNTAGGTGDAAAPAMTPANTGNAAASGKAATNNGLFPQMATTTSTGRFGGGLFPDFVPTANGQGASVAATESGSESGSDTDPFDLGEDFFVDAADGADSMSQSGTSPVSVETATSLLPQARMMFEKHREDDAVRLLYANYLVSDECRQKYPLNWYAGLKEPRLLFRWGVGVIYKRPRDFEGRHPVIGDPGDENENVSGNSSRPPQGAGRRGGLGAAAVGGGSSGGGSRGSRAYKNIDTSRPDGFLMFYTGDFGERLISFLDQRRTDEDRPYYGGILKDVMETELPADDETGEAETAAAGGGRSGLPDASGNAPQIGALNGLQDGGGGPGGRGRGQPGTDNAQPVVRTDTSVLDRAMGQSTAEQPEDDTMGSIVPGVMLVGVGSKAELVERAKASELDSLIVFNVRLSKSRRSSNSSRSGPTRFNTTSMRIIDLHDDSNPNLFNSKALKDTDVQESLDEGEDPVTQEIERAFETMADKMFQADDLPEGLNSENVRKRVGRLLQDQPSNPLPSAVEIIGFLERDLLSEEDAVTALSRLFDSPDAAVLVNGSPGQRIEFMRQWLPEDIDI